MESHSTVNKRADTFTLENAHPTERHYESGEPVFVGRSKHVHKRVNYFTLYCADCSDTDDPDGYVPLYNNDHGEDECINECGYISGAGPRLELSLAAAGRYQDNL